MYIGLSGLRNAPDKTDRPTIRMRPSLPPCCFFAALHFTVLLLLLHKDTRAI